MENVPWIYVESFRQQEFSRAPGAVTGHRIFQSIYFFAPNGIRLEPCVQLASDAQMNDEKKGIHDKIAGWSKEKAERLAHGREVS